MHVEFDYVLLLTSLEMCNVKPGLRSWQMYRENMLDMVDFLWS